MDTLPYYKVNVMSISGNIFGRLAFMSLLENFLKKSIFLKLLKNAKIRLFFYNFSDLFKIEKFHNLTFEVVFDTNSYSLNHRKYIFISISCFKWIYSLRGKMEYAIFLLLQNHLKEIILFFNSFDHIIVNGN